MNHSNSNNNKNINKSNNSTRDEDANNKNLITASNISADREVARGLVNLGNTCYANAVLQSLAHAPDWCNAMELTPHRAVCRWNSLRTNLELKQGEDEETPPFCLLCEVEHIISSLHSTPSRDVTATTATANTISPTRFMENFTSTVAPWFRKGLQEDSHEFLRLLTDAMQKASITNSCCTALTANPTHDYNVYSDYPIQLFRGQIQSTVTCLACHQISTTVEPMEDIGLECIYYSQQPTNNSSQKLASIQHSLNKLIQQEALECYKCERCHTVGKATKQSKILEIPPILTLHVKRFRYGTATTAPTPTLSTYNKTSNTADMSSSTSINNGSNTPNSSTSAAPTTTNAITPSTANYTLTNTSTAAGRTGSKKIEGYIKFDELLDLQPYLTEDWQYSFGSNTGTIERSDTTTIPSANKKRSCYCRLFAVVVHTGSSSHSGHYYALVRNLKKNEWWKMDDGNSVRLASSSEVTNAHAYMLFYRSVEHPISIQLRDGVLRQRNQQKQQQEEEEERKKKQTLEQTQQKPSNSTSTATMSNEDTQSKPNTTPTKMDMTEFNKVQGSLKQNNIQTTAHVLGDEEIVGTVAPGEEEVAANKGKIIDSAIKENTMDGVTAVTNVNKKRKDATNTYDRHANMTLEEWIVQPKKKWPKLTSIASTTSSNTHNIVPLLKQAQTWVSEKVQLNADYFHKLTEDSKVSENFVFQDDILQQMVSKNGCQGIKSSIKYLLRKLLTPVATTARQLNDEDKRKQRQLLMAQAVVVDDIPVSPVSNATNSSLSILEGDDLLAAEQITPGSRTESVVAAGGSMNESSRR